MTRKDYVLIAKALKEAHASKEVVATLCSALEDDNVRFDDDKFLRACGFDV